MSYNEITHEIDSTFFNLLYPLVTESIAKRKVLLVDHDIDEYCTIEAAMSEDPQIELQVARDADEAMILMIQTKYDLVVIEDHHYSTGLHHPGYIYKSENPKLIISDIRKYFDQH